MPFLNPEGYLDDMSDEEIQQLIALGIIPDQQSDIKDQMKLAEQLRYNNSPEMRHGSRVSTAAHPLEFIASAIQGIKAQKQLEDLRKQQGSLLDEQVKGRSNFFKALRG